MAIASKKQPGHLDRMLTMEMARVVEAAAVAAARQRGQGDEKKADQVAVDAMRNELNNLPISGRIVIGERTNIQDGSVVHVSTGGIHTAIGDDVLIGHMALVHGSDAIRMPNIIPYDATAIWQFMSRSRFRRSITQFSGHAAAISVSGAGALVYRESADDACPLCRLGPGQDSHRPVR